MVGRGNQQSPLFRNRRLRLLSTAVPSRPPVGAPPSRRTLLSAPFSAHCVLSTVPNMTKRIQRVLGMAVLALTASACGPSFTPEEATAECDRLRNDLTACFTDEVYDQCVACHEECGRDCSLLDSCPHQFVCD